VEKYRLHIGEGEEIYKFLFLFRLLSEEMSLLWKKSMLGISCFSEHSKKKERDKEDRHMAYVAFNFVCKEN
jgi:hypothetical protein